MMTSTMHVVGFLVACACSASAFSPLSAKLLVRTSALSSATRRGVAGLRAAATSPQSTGNPFQNMGNVFEKLRAPSFGSPLPATPSPAVKTAKVGVLFLNLGGPESLDEVEDFLFNLFNDPDIIRLPEFLQPLQSVIARRVANKRAPNSREAYESIGGGSPIVELTQDQATKLEGELAKRGIDCKVYIGMRYWYPFTEEAVDKLLEDEVERLVVLPLYPQYSISTSGSSLRLLNQIIKENPTVWDPRKIDHTVVPDWFDHPGYLSTQAKLITRELDEFKNNPKDVKVLFSAHGVPVSYVAAGDPYKKQIEQCAELIMQKVNENHPGKYDYNLCFQSRVGPVKWLEPYTDDVLKELGAGGLKNIVVVPLSFVSEHVETLEEIDQEYREVAEEAGIHNFKRVPALNSDPEFITCLADLTTTALEKPALRVSECLRLYQGTDCAPGGSWLQFGVTKNTETINGRIAMLAISALAVSQVIKAGCPPILGPSIAGKEPFCAAFSADGWSWLFNFVQSLQM